MSWIRVIDEDEATGKLKEIYTEIIKKRGKISNVMKIHSLNPDSMKKHLDLYITLLFSSSGLSREECEFISLVVSSANNCEYCINHHTKALNHYWKDNEKIQKFLQDFESVDISIRECKILDYVLKLTKTPYKIKKSDIDVLRLSGFSDEEILSINLIACYFNFVNRIALGRGVEFSSDEASGYKY